MITDIENYRYMFLPVVHITSHAEVRFASFLSVGFITVIVVNPPERRPARPTSVHLLSIRTCAIEYPC